MLTRFTIERPWVVVISLAILIGVCALFIPSVFSRLQNGGLKDPGSESAQVENTLEGFGQGSSDIVALYHTEDTVDDPVVLAELLEIIVKVEKDPRVLTMTSEQTSGAAFLTDKSRERTAVLVALKGDDPERTASYPAIREMLMPPEGISVTFTGWQPINLEMEHIILDDLIRGELVALPLAFLVLWAFFRRFWVALLPVLLGGVTTLFALAILGVLTTLMPISIFAANCVTFLSIGMAIDSSLFMVARFREELRKDDMSIAAAVTTTKLTAGRAIMFSGFCVVLSMFGLLLFPQILMRSLGIAGIATTLSANFLVFILMPALLVIFGERIREGANSRANVSTKKMEAFAHWVMDHATSVIIVVTLLLAFTAYPFLRFEASAIDFSSLPKDSPVRMATEELYKTIAPNLVTPMEVLVTFPSEETNAETVDLAYDVHKTITKQPGVSSILGIFSLTDEISPDETWEYLRKNPNTTHEAMKAFRNKNVLRFVVFGDSNYNSKDSKVTVQALRDMKIPGVEISVGGASASLLDLIDVLKTRAPYAFLGIFLATFLVLVLVFKSLAIPIKATFMTTLSLGASFGALVWVFQDGRFTNLLAYEASGLSDAPQPVFLFCLIFGLSLDYEMILLLRIQEEFKAGRTLVDAIAVGVARTGPLITVAAVILIIVVGAFAGSEILSIKQVGFGIALAVAIDATIVRLLLVPATMKLLGEYNWWPWQKKIVDAREQNRSTTISE